MSSTSPHSFVLDGLAASGRALAALAALSPLYLAAGAVGWFLLSALLFYLYRFPFNEWAFSRQTNLRGPPRDHFLLGNHRYMLDRVHPRPCVKGWIDGYGDTGRIHGLLGEQKVYTADPVAMQYIVNNNDMFPKSKSMQILFGRLLGQGLLTTEGDVHRRQRRLLNPAFSPRAVKDMSPILFDKARVVRDKIFEILEGGPEKMDIGALIMKTTLDAIGAAGFDYDFDTLNAKRTELAEALSNAIKAMQKSALISTLQTEFWILNAIPTPGKKLGLTSRATMNRVGAKIVSEKTAVVTDRIEKNTDLATADLLSRLIRANLASDLEERDRLTELEMRAQICTFIFAGSETIAVALNCTIYRLACDHALQDRLRAEITTLPPDADLDQIQALPYLENFTREVLRVDGPVPLAPRGTAAAKAVIPLSRPIVGRDGRTMDNIVVHKGTEILLCLDHVNRDKKVWGEDADEFNPDRFDRPSPHLESVPGVYGNLMTFMGGPRNCIGWRFAIAEFKITICTLVRAFEFDQLAHRPGIASETVFGVVRVSTPGEEGVVPLCVRPIGDRE